MRRYICVVGPKDIVGELPGPGELLGVACLCIGVLSLALVRRGSGASRKGIAYALVTGLLIAAYTVVDALGRGSRAHPSASWCC